MMIRQPQPSEDTQTLLQTYRQDHPVVRRTDVQPLQWQNVQISSLGQLVHQLKQRQRVVTPRWYCQDNTHHDPQEHRLPSLPPRQAKRGWVCMDSRDG